MLAQVTEMRPERVEKANEKREVVSNVLGK